MRALHHDGASAPGLAMPERLYVLRPHDLVPMGADGGGLARLSEPRKDEAHRLAGAAGFRDQTSKSETYCADAPAVDQDGVTTKRLATLRARAALAGLELACMADGSFRVSRWGLMRSFTDVAAVEAFLQVNAR